MEKISDIGSAAKNRIGWALLNTATHQKWDPWEIPYLRLGLNRYGFSPPIRYPIFFPQHRPISDPIRYFRHQCVYNFIPFHGAIGHPLYLLNYASNCRLSRSAASAPFLILQTSVFEVMALFQNSVLSQITNFSVNVISVNIGKCAQLNFADPIFYR